MKREGAIVRRRAWAVGDRVVQEASTVSALALINTRWVAFGLHAWRMGAKVAISKNSREPTAMTASSRRTVNK